MAHSFFLKQEVCCSDCRTPKVKNISGRRFGRLTAIKYAGKSKGKQTLWECWCDCGKTVIVHQQNLNNGHTTSCGCYNSEVASEREKEHGQSRTRLYNIWHDMIYRCYNDNRRSYKDYGGKGIIVCKEWKDDFETFRNWAIKNGYKENLSIDRIDSHKNYCPDSKTVKHLLEDLDILGFGKTKFVMDRGFYSEDNINGLYRDHIKFLVGTKLSLKFIRKHLDEVYDDIRMFVNFDESINTYGYTVSVQWEYTQERPYKGDVIKDKRRMYIHYYYSIENGADDEQAFDKRIASLCKELSEGKYVESHKKAYDQFFEVKTTPKRGRQVYYKEDAIKEARRYFGYFALITNEKMDAFTALHLYRMKDVVEKAFGNLKERLNMRRLLVSSEKGLDGKIFTEFVALILISHLDHKMKKSDLYKNYTLHQLLDELDVIECFEDANHSLRIGELINKQAKIYEALGVKVPTSSC